MSEKLKESLSAVIDGEADEFELRRVLDEMHRDEVLAGSWERYHVIGSVLRGERATVGIAMRERVWAELQADPDVVKGHVPGSLEIVAGKPPAAEPAKRQWMPVAVAATVALAVVVGFAAYSGSDQAALSPVVAVVDEPVSAQQQSLFDTVALSSEITDSDQNRTDAYIVRHYQQIGMDRPGLGFARMVAYERD
jgi:sigma-E factor negative regulatory protein RseA